MRKLVILRRLSQAAFFLFFVYVLWSTTYPLTGAVSSQALFKIDPLIMLMTALSERVLLPGLVFAGGMMLFTFILGRFFCGWVCPLGTMIDWTGCLNRSCRGTDGLATDWRRSIRKPKFVIFALIAALALLGIQAAWVLDPIVTAARVVSLSVIPDLTLAVDSAFQIIIQRFHLYGGMYDLYRSLKGGILGVNVHLFDNSLITLVVFTAICLASVFILRLWCRMLCPLGALYALNAAPSWLERRVSDCTSCGICSARCRMGAIEDGPEYRKGECILCMDCVYDCPQKSTVFSFRRSAGATGSSEKGVTRGQFLYLFLSAIPFLNSKTVHAAVGGAEAPGHPVIRPPAALPEERFIDTCVRCGNCMKVCITNGLQPVMLETGLEGLWTPQLVPEIGYCEHKCTLCGQVCPTGAIPRLSEDEKKKVKIGLAELDKKLCLALDGNKECIVCEEHCPTAEKAIKLKEEVFEGKKIFRPSVDAELCTGCGICQTKCPVRPVRAIRVNPRKIAV